MGTSEDIWEEQLLISFYSATVESVVMHRLPVWYAGCSAADKQALWGAVRTAENKKYKWPYLADTQTSTKHHQGVLSPSELLHSSRGQRSTKTHTSRLRDLSKHHLCHLHAPINVCTDNWLMLLFIAYLLYFLLLYLQWQSYLVLKNAGLTHFHIKFFKQRLL